MASFQQDNGNTTHSTTALQHATHTLQLMLFSFQEWLQVMGREEAGYSGPPMCSSSLWHTSVQEPIHNTSITGTCTLRIILLKRQLRRLTTKIKCSGNLRLPSLVNMTLMYIRTSEGARIGTVTRGLHAYRKKMVRIKLRTPLIPLGRTKVIIHMIYLNTHQWTCSQWYQVRKLHFTEQYSM